MARISSQEKLGLKYEDNYDSDPNLHTIKPELVKIMNMLNAIKADINHAVSDHSGALQSAISVDDITL